MRFAPNGLKRVVLAGILATQAMSAIGQTAIQSEALEPSFQKAVAILSNREFVAKTTIRVVPAVDMTMRGSPAEVHLNYTTQSCDVLVSNDVDNDEFVATIMTVTGWSRDATALFITAHELQHCDDFAKMGQTLSGVRKKYGNEIIAALLPSQEWASAMASDKEAWSMYKAVNRDHRAQRLREASGDIGGILAVHKAYGVTAEQVAALSQLRYAEGEANGDTTHDTSPWLTALASKFADVEKIKSLTGHDPIASMTARQTASFIYQHINEAKPTGIERVSLDM